MAAGVLDRIEPRTPTGPRFTPRDLPEDGDVAAYVARGVSAAGFRLHARATVHAPAAVVAARIHPAVGVVEPVTTIRVYWLRAWTA